ncbi:MAG TPA: geopeptide radical SAM maturase [Dissulfurispiraceae bacterium]|nr:geopeptide radical SAM maturase [Dissulfurispiraceae bacterium]
MPLSTYCISYPSPDNPDSHILFLTKSSAKALITSSLLLAIDQETITEAEKASLQRPGFIVDDIEQERTDMAGFTERVSSLSRIFYVKLVMNLDCNLACAYCFEGSRKGRLYMSGSTADLFAEFVKGRLSPNKKEIRVTFYGGEPLLSSRRIIYIAARLKDLAEEKGIDFGFSLVTNGTLLTREIVDQLKPLGLRTASVTLDGPGDIHDRYRPFTSGKGSFATILANIKAVCDMTGIQIGGNYTRENFCQFPRLLDCLMENGLTPERISDIRFDPVTGESDEFVLPDFREACLSMDEPWLNEASVYLREEILRRGYRVGRIVPVVCMMEQQDNLVVNYNGDIYKCAGLIGRKEFCVGDLNTGIKDFHLSHNLDNWKNERCLSCAYLPLCFGGCRYLKLIRDGDMKGVDCRKSYLDAVLESLVLQDVKYANQILK